MEIQTHNGYNPVNGLRYPKDVRWTGDITKAAW